MTTYISILRGINVSGHKLIKMDALAQLYSELGFQAIQTYIQSGNVIFQYRKTTHEALEKNISEKISDKYEYSVPVMVMESIDLEDILKNNPFIIQRNEEPSKLHVTFLSQEPEKVSIDKIIAAQYLPDEFIVSKKTIYLFCPNGYGRTKLTNTFFENKLKVVATTRNWKTVAALYNLATSNPISFRLNETPESL